MQLILQSCLCRFWGYGSGYCCKRRHSRRFRWRFVTSHVPNLVAQYFLHLNYIKFCHSAASLQVLNKSMTWFKAVPHTESKDEMTDKGESQQLVTWLGHSPNGHFCSDDDFSALSSPYLPHLASKCDRILVWGSKYMIDWERFGIKSPPIHSEVT